MTSSRAMCDLSGRRVLVPGGTGAVGEGIVRRFLAAGADVLVPTRTQGRAEEFRHVLTDAGDRSPAPRGSRLHDVRRCGGFHPQQAGDGCGAMTTLENPPNVLGYAVAEWGPAHPTDVLLTLGRLHQDATSR